MPNTIEEQPKLKFLHKQVYLPFDKKTPMENIFIGLLISDSTQMGSILKNKLFKQTPKIARYYKPFQYKDKIFNTNIRYKMNNDEKHQLTDLCKTYKLSFFNKPNSIKNKNIVVDTSLINQNFINHCLGKSYMLTCVSYIEHLSYYLKTTCSGLKQERRYLFLNTQDWDINEETKSKILTTNQKMINPLSMIYFLIKKNSDKLELLKDYTIVISDGSEGWFYWDMKDLDNRSFSQIYALITKFKSHPIDLDKTVDTDKEVMLKDIEKKTYDDLEKNDKKFGDATYKAIPDNDSDDEITEDEVELAKKAIEDNHDSIARTVSNNKRLKRLMEKQRSIKIDNISMASLENEIPEENYNIEVDDISSKLFTPIESVKKIRFNNNNKSYNENTKEKDIMNVFRSLNNKKDLPVFITSIKKEDTSNAMNLKETWHIRMQSSDGVQHSVTVDIPKIYDDNYLYLSGNRKQFDNQQVLKPLIKIAPDTVQICTNYNKIFMYRLGDIASPKITVFKKIILNNLDKFRIRRGNATKLSNGHITSIEYDSLAKDFVEITIKNKGIGLKFDQKFFDEKVNSKEIDPIGDDFIYCIWDGRKNTKIKAYPIELTTDDVQSTDSKYDGIAGPIDLFCEIYRNETGKEFWDLAGTKDKPGKRFMYSSCTVMGKKIPTIIMLGYFEGLTTVMNKAEIKYRFTDKREHLTLDEGMIPFSDGFLIYERIPTENGLLLNALSMYDTKAYKYEEFDTKDPYLDIFAANYDGRKLGSGLDAYYDNMIDPITEEILKQMDLPTDFVKLVICANALLSDNSYSSELSLTEFRVRNLEMISAYLYKEISNAYSTYKRTASNKNPNKISIPKDAVIKDILLSNIVEDVSVINPITEKEKQRAITCKGPTGINVDRAFTKEKRCFDKTMTGAMTISTSPDGNCGVVRELTVNPKVVNTRGFVDCKEPDSEMDQTRLFGYSELVNGVGVVMDDAIRTAMASKQNKHVIPTRDMSPVLLSTGVEKMLPYVATKDFVVRAKDDGKIVDYDEKTHMMIAEYKDRTHEAINLGNQVVKNGGGGFFLENRMNPLYKKGQKFKKNDVLAANKDYYGNHYDGEKFNLGTLAKVAVMSSFATFEDSNMITEKLSNRMATEMVMQKHVVLGPHATVSQIVHEGDNVVTGDPLITFEQSNEEEDVNVLLKSIGQDLKEEINKLGKNVIQSKYTGIISEVRIYSTEELNDLSPSLKKIVGDYWKNIKKKKELIRKYQITDPSYQGGTFYELDEPIKPDANGKVKGYQVDNGVIIEFYIKFFDTMKPGDKLTHMLALKGTVSLVIPDDQAPYTVNEPDVPIESCIPASSILARQVFGIMPTMFTQKIIVELKKKLKKMYED